MMWVISYGQPSNVDHVGRSTLQLIRRPTSSLAVENSQRGLISNTNNGLMSEGSKQRGTTHATLTPGFFLACNERGTLQAVTFDP